MRIGGVLGLLDGVPAVPNIKEVMFGGRAGRTTFNLSVSCAGGRNWGCTIIGRPASADPPVTGSADVAVAPGMPRSDCTN